jgi:hypothetical protein
MIELRQIMGTDDRQQRKVPADRRDPTAERFEAFSASIVSPSIKAVMAQWQAARRSQMMPSWEQLRPSGMAKQLPIVWSYRYDRETEQFIGRLAGDKISQIFGKNFRGLPLQNAHPPAAFPWVHRLVSRVVLEPAVYRSSGRVFKQLDRYGLGERIMLPLATDGVTADGLLGATEYQYPHPSAANGPIEAETDGEDWLSLLPVRSG